MPPERSHPAPDALEPTHAARPGDEWVILVDAHDQPIGVMEKMGAHLDGGALHRAFSVFLFDAHGRMLLQRRAAVKYHFPLLWTNACCGHPRPGEDVEAAAVRRVGEELGVDVEIEPSFTFTYRATDAMTGLSEHEIDHVFVGRLGDRPQPCPSEVDDLAWWAVDDLFADIEAHPDAYTPWFVTALDEMRRRGVFERMIERSGSA